MYPGHPWQGEDYGEIEYLWYIERGYVFTVEFDVKLKPFIEFCKDKGHRSHQLTMKIASRLSTEHLPQITHALNHKVYPSRYPAGYIRPIRDGADMLEHIAVREQDGYFVERDIRAHWNPRAIWLATKHPRISLWLAKTVFGQHEVKNNYALMVSRNPLRGLNTRVVFHGTNYRTFVLGIPFGDVSTCFFGAPHAFGNINYYEPMLAKFKTYMEEPDKIPPDLLEKQYREAPRASQETKQGK